MLHCFQASDSATDPTRNSASIISPLEIMNFRRLQKALRAFPSCAAVLTSADLVRACNEHEARWICLAELLVRAWLFHGIYDEMHEFLEGSEVPDTYRSIAGQFTRGLIPT